MLTDFGLAKGRAYTVLTKPGQVMGTLDYLAPELIKGSPATPGDRHLRARLHDLRMRRRTGAVPDKQGIQVGLAHVAEPPPELSRVPRRHPTGLRGRGAERPCQGSGRPAGDGSRVRPATGRNRPVGP